MVIQWDDVDVSFCNDYFVAAEVVLMPHLGGVLVADEKSPCFFATNQNQDKQGLEIQTRSESCWQLNSMMA